MRKWIIDTDGGTDDAVAIIMALRDDNIKIEAITTLSPLAARPIDEITSAVCAFVEVANTYHPPIYKGYDCRLFPNRGKPFESDFDPFEHAPLPKTEIKPEKKHALDAMVELIEANPGEIEIIALGPATTLAHLILEHPGTIKKVKQIVAMAGTGLGGRGNASPVAEGNVHMDAEAFEILLQQSGVPILMVGWDMSLDDYMLNEGEVEYLLQSGSPIAQFCVNANHWLIELNEKWFGRRPVIDQPDPVTVAVAADPSLILESIHTHHFVDLKGQYTYGEVVIDVLGHYAEKRKNATTCLRLDIPRLKKYMLEKMI